MAPAEGPDRDWSDLPPELIRLLSRKLTDIFDFVRFRVVCKRWRSAVRASDLPPQLPWITDECWTLERGYLRFYSLLTGKTYTVRVQQSSDGELVMGSAYNYVLSYDYLTQDCSLFNPLTNEELLLPPSQIMFPWCVPSGLSPDQSSRYVIMSTNVNLRTTHLIFCKLGDLEWTNIQEEIPWCEFYTGGGKFINEGFAFHAGMCYASDTVDGFTEVINLATRTVMYVVPQPKSHLTEDFVYLVVSSGEILRVCQYNKYSREPCFFRIYRLELSSRDGNVVNPCWIEIDNLSGQFLFLHEKHGCAFRADDFPGFIGNNIYFLKQMFEDFAYELFRYDIKDGNVEVLHVPIKLGRSWFVPSLCQQIA
ncbi:F-box family protein [Rhynchospora pubera]|uniref:F-box family protein n=1 Tax=Rhynchospora pubera TaxID=906938 RepID=A0AAV8GMY9_9POAL|nr:F-box family protein [Rhynchospora pubera]